MTNFELRNMAVVVVGKGGGGKRGGGGLGWGGGATPPPPPSPLFTLKPIPFQANSYDYGWVCLHGKHILDSIASICNSNDYNILQWNLY